MFRGFCLLQQLQIYMLSKQTNFKLCRKFWGRLDGGSEFVTPIHKICQIFLSLTFLHIQFLGWVYFYVKGVSHYWKIGFIMFVRREINSSNMSKTIWPRITKFYRDIHTNIVYSHTGYEAIIYFRSKIIAKKLLKIPLPTASGGISRKWFKLRSRNFTRLSRTIQSHILARNDVTSCFCSAFIKV